MVAMATRFPLVHKKKSPKTEEDHVRTISVKSKSN